MYGVWREARNHDKEKEQSTKNTESNEHILMLIMLDMSMLCVVFSKESVREQMKKHITKQAT